MDARDVQADSDAPATMARPTVLYIAGSGRSGSTLLERIVGTVDGYVNVGELVDVARRVAPHDELCGCGEPFSRCPFWTRVGVRAFGGWTHDAISRLDLLQDQVARQRHMPALVATGGRRDAPTAYRQMYRQLYRAVLEESGARYVVDASKWPAQALALHGQEIDVRVVHLVRDLRGVAYSLRKEHVRRPHATDTSGESGESGEMVRSSLARSALTWNKTQVLIDALRLTGMRVERLDYEDLVGAPAPSIRDVLVRLGLEVLPDAFGHIDDDTVDLPASHGLSGNPSRFQTGRIKLRPDAAWQAGLTRLQATSLMVAARPQAVSSTLTRTVTSKSATRGRDRSTMPTTEQDALTGEETEPLRDAPLVSVLIPTRNRPELLRLTLRSVLDQNYPGPIECLIVHDQEPVDEDLTTWSTTDRRVTVMNNDHTPGLAGARNTALAHAEGAFVATCDDDDLWHTDKLTTQIAMLQQEPDLLAVGSGIRLLFSDDNIVEWRGRAEVVDPRALARNRFKELHSSTMVVRRDAYAKAGGYDEELPHGYAEDYDFVLRLTRVGKVGIVLRPLADIRKNVQSWFRGRASNNAEALRYMLAKHPAIRQSRRGHARLLGQIAFAEASAGDRRAGLRTATQALRRYPLAPHAMLAIVQATTNGDPQRLLRTANKFGRGLA